MRGPCLVSYYRSAGGSCVGGDDHAAVVETSDDGGSRRGGFGERDTLGVQRKIAVVVAEVEAGHCRGW